MAREPFKGHPNLELDQPPAPVNPAAADSARSFDTKGFETPDPEPSGSLDTAYFDDKKESKVGADSIRTTPLARNFGRYRLQDVLGRGGMGEVYLAFDTELRRNVALKAPKLVVDSPLQRDRFKREARSAAALQHPNLCVLHDVGEIDGQLYLTMAYVDGPSLSALLREHGPMEPDQAAELIRKIALAMQHAHEIGLLHRDLKPGNILLTKKGEPVVTDFGLAFEFKSESNERLTESGMVVGTPTYMPPEQVNGQPLGPTGDVYSLGVVFYELLTGKPPFSGPIGKLIAQIETAVPEPPSQICRRLDPKLEAICQKALAKQPAERFADMAAFAQALDRYAQDKKERSLTEQTAQLMHRNMRRRVAALVGVAVVVMAGTISAAVVWARRGERPVENVPEMTLTDAERLFDALAKPLVKIDVAIGDDTPLYVGRKFFPAGLFEIPGLDGGKRIHDGPLYFSISGNGNGHVLDLSDQPGQAGQITFFGGEITVNAPYLLFLGNLTPSSRVYVKGGIGYSILAPMNGGIGCKHVEFDGTHLLMPKINFPAIDSTMATGADIAALRNPDLIQKTVWKYDNTEYVIFCRPGTKVVPGNHEERKVQFPAVYDIIEMDRRRQSGAPMISNSRVQQALRESGLRE